MFAIPANISNSNDYICFDREKREKADTEKENDVDDKNDWGTELTRQQLLGNFL